VPIEPYLSDQWYCKVTDPRLAERAIEVMNAEQRTSRVGSSNEAGPSLTFFPERYAKTFQTWHENIRDWCISRQLWWGHRIPVWSANHDFGEGIKTVFAHGATTDSFAPIAITLRFPDADIPDCTVIRQVRRDEVGEVRYYVCVPPDREDVERLLEQRGFVRDPDVLDTWFSSALWPLSTLGWPDRDAVDNPRSALNVWNPTTVLCTAREIITLWVSRMVMFNLFFLDRLPFRDVFIHAMIQDGEGRKMSKSLGNGVDPLDIIRSHGADAMRFTLASMATNTQDVRMPVERDPQTGTNTSPKFDLGRNFCNKLWNAARFVLMSIDGVPVEPIDELKWTVADRWIVSRFNRTVQEANDALADYRFDQYARAGYDFFWRDFCDWYVECAKAQMRDPAQRGQTAAVLAATLDGALRLLHPVTPFITEKLWAALNATRPQRGLPGRIACPTPQDGARFEHVIRAPWPGVGDVSQAAEFIFPKLQEIITAIRTVRSDYKVDPKRAVTVSIRAPGDAARQIELMKPQIELLTVSRISAVGADVAAPARCAKASAAGCEVFVEGLVDESAEQQRLAKRRDELSRQIDAMKKRLSNEGYIAKAPPALVQQTKDQLTAAETELAKLGG
jgi:valyl-tRNA synthetase